VKRRLDLELVERGLLATRARARDAILRGRVMVDGRVAVKPGDEIARSACIAVDPAAARYVSRGAEKLAAGLDAFGFAPKGRIVLDLGASTGGFTEVLLERGAAKVFAVDVGRDQLHERMRRDPRVVSLEETDARRLDGRIVPEPVGAIVADVSFISLTKALTAALDLAGAGAWLVALVKPQFEVGRDFVGKGGIVRDEAARTGAVSSVQDFLADAGWQIAGMIDSPITGGDGNREFLLGAVKA
jgi:23S rRNA (cytidine1920-2'-O)/16S rRNA (cytidine1409-2'-O)-methyltransferase